MSESQHVIESIWLMRSMINEVCHISIHHDICDRVSVKQVCVENQEVPALLFDVTSLLHDGLDLPRCEHAGP